MYPQNNSSRHLDPASFAAQLRNRIDTLATAANDLRQALIGQQVDTIWSLLETKKQLAVAVENDLQLWNELYGTSPSTNSLDSYRNDIRTSLQSLQRIEHTNASLSRSCVAAVHQALSSGELRRGGKKCPYNRRGRSGGVRTSMLVSKLG